MKKVHFFSSFSPLFSPSLKILEGGKLTKCHLPPEYASGFDRHSSMMLLDSSAQLAVSQQLDPNTAFPDTFPLAFYQGIK